MRKLSVRSRLLGALGPTLLTSLAAVAAAAAQGTPVPVSPGDPAALGALSHRCPSFHWTPVADAVAIELVVVEAPGAGTPFGADGASMPTALRVRLPGGAAGYSAPPTGCLSRGKTYAWMVRAIGDRDGDWSEPRFFTVPAQPSADELEDALEIVRSHRRARSSSQRDAGSAPIARSERATTLRPAPESMAGVAERLRGPLPRDGRRPARRRERDGSVVAAANDGARVRGTAAANAPDPSEGASLSVDQHLRLAADSSVFKEDELFLWDDEADNTALGRGALAANTTGTSSTAVGARALANNQGEPYYGSFNTAVGAGALELNVYGDRNTSVGFHALRDNLDAFANAALGAYALQHNNEDGNTAVGYEALRYNTDGAFNSALGMRALRFNLGESNTAVGAYTLDMNTGGNANTAVGRDALRYNTEGSDNAALGYSAGANTTGNRNVAIGTVALKNNTTGNSNVAIGYGALLNAGRDGDSGSYNIAIGYSAGAGVGDQYPAGSDNIHIGHYGEPDDDAVMRLGQFQTATYIAGIFGAMLSSPTGAHPVWIDQNGKLGDQPESSRRFKEDIRDLGDDSRAILDLRPVSFRYKRDGARGEEATAKELARQTGLVAEEVAEVMPSLVELDSEGRPLRVRYHALVPLLLNELQRQERELSALREEVEQLRRARRATGDRTRRPASSPSRR